MDEIERRLEDMEKRLRWTEKYCFEHEGKIEERWDNQWRHNTFVDGFITEVRDRLRSIDKRMWIAAGAAGIVAAVASSFASWVFK